MSTEDSSYSEQESALILQRAAELQAQQGRSLSLPELESAASEAGIDVALVRRAAQEVTTLSPAAPAAAPARGGALGSPLRLVHERVIDGPIDPSRISAIQAEIEWQLGRDVPDLARQAATALKQGGPDVHPEVRTEPPRPMMWQSSRGRKIQVSLVPRAGRTIIRVEERLGDLAGSLFMGMGLPTTVGGLGFILPICIAVIDMPVLIPVAFVAWAALVFGFARLLFTTISRQRNPQLQALADGLTEVCRQDPPR